MWPGGGFSGGTVQSEACHADAILPGMDGPGFRPKGFHCMEVKMPHLLRRPLFENPHFGLSWRWEGGRATAQTLASTAIEVLGRTAARLVTPALPGVWNSIEVPVSIGSRGTQRHSLDDGPDISILSKPIKPGRLSDSCAESSFEGHL